MKRPFIFIFSFIAIVSMSFMFANTPPRYKNLKVLPKDINKEQMDSVMHHFSASLNVKCSYCHSFNQEQKSMDFASDEKKEKNIARDMWRMTAKVNSKYFHVEDSKKLGTKLEVTCITCHNGAAHPTSKTPSMRMGPPSGAGPQGQRPPGETPSQMPRSGNDTTKH